MRCAECGFDPSSVSPADAIVALRSFPRRYRELLTPSEGDMAAMEGEERWATVMTAAAEAGAAIEDLAGDLEAVFVHDEPALHTDQDVATELRYPGDPRSALERLTLAATHLADLASSHHGDDWSRKGVRSDGPVSALDVLRDSVHAGVHHLRRAEADLSR